MRLKSVGLLAFAMLFVAGPVLAAAYSAPFTVIESNSNDYTILPVSVSVGNQWLADNGFMDADGLDTRIQTLGGYEYPHLVVDDRTLAALPVLADTQTNLYFTTDNSSLTDMPIIVGYNGRVAITDVAPLELGNNFEVEIDGYIDTSSGSNKNLVYKREAIRTYISAASEITAEITDINNLVGTYPQVVGVAGEGLDNSLTPTWDLPDGNTGDLMIIMVAADNGPTISFPAPWTELFNTLNNLRFAAAYYIDTDGVGGTIEVTLGVSKMSTATIYRISDYSGVPEVGVSATGSSANPDSPSLSPTWGSEATLWLAVMGYDGANYSVSSYPANYTDGRNDRDGYSTNAGVGSARRELTADPEDPGTFTLNGSEEWVAQTIAVAPAYDVLVSVTATGVSSGEHEVKVTADTTNLKIYIDDQEEDSTALGGGSVPDNANDWALIMNNAVSNADFIKITVGGTLIVWYQPVTMIIGTVLPDREGAAQNGAITWGSNPAGVTVTMGGMVSGDQPIPGMEDETGTDDILPAIGVSDWFEEPDVSGTLLNNPLRPLVTLMSDTTSITELQAWRILALSIILLVTVSAIMAVRGHLLVAGIVAGASIGATVALTIFPLWALVFVIISILGGVVAERSPSL